MKNIVKSFLGEELNIGDNIMYVFNNLLKQGIIENIIHHYEHEGHIKIKGLKKEIFSNKVVKHKELDRLQSFCNMLERSHHDTGEDDAIQTAKILLELNADLIPLFEVKKIKDPIKYVTELIMKKPEYE